MPGLDLPEVIIGGTAGMIAPHQRAFKHLNARLDLNDYGAKPDDPTFDNTAALTLVYADAVTRGGARILVSKPGRYYFLGTSLPEVGGDNIEIVGIHRATVFYAPNLGGGQSVIWFDTRSNCAVTNMTIDVPAALSNNQHGILFKDCTNCEAKGNYVPRLDRGIWFTNTVDQPNSGAYTVNINNRALNNETFSTYGYGIHVMHGRGNWVVSNHTHHTRSQDGIKILGESVGILIWGNISDHNNRDGMDFMDGLAGSIVWGNICEYNTLEGLDVKGTVGGVNNTVSNYVVIHTFIGGNILRNNTDGLHITDVRDVSFSGNICYGNTNGAILTDVEGCTFTGEHWNYNNQYGRRDVVGVHGNTFSACSWSNNSCEGPGYDGARCQTQTTGQSNWNINIGCIASRSKTRSVGGGTVNAGSVTITAPGLNVQLWEIGAAIRIQGGPSGAEWYSDLKIRNGPDSFDIEAAPPWAIAGTATITLGDPNNPSQQDRGMNFVQGTAFGNIVRDLVARGNVTGPIGGTVQALETDNDIAAYRDDTGYVGMTVDTVRRAVARNGLKVLSGLYVPTVTAGRVPFVGGTGTTAGLVDSSADLTWDDTKKVLHGKFLQSATGATGARPAANSVPAGSQWYDTTLHKPIWSDGASWRDAMANIV